MISWAGSKTQDDFDDKTRGHVDTRETNFNGEDPDKNLECNL